MNVLQSSSRYNTPITRKGRGGVGSPPRARNVVATVSLHGSSPRSPFRCKVSWEGPAPVPIPGSPGGLGGPFSTIAVFRMSYGMPGTITPEFAFPLHSTADVGFVRYRKIQQAKSTGKISFSSTSITSSPLESDKKIDSNKIEKMSIGSSIEVNHENSSISGADHGAGLSNNNSMNKHGLINEVSDKGNGEFKNGILNDVSDKGNNDSCNNISTTDDCDSNTAEDKKNKDGNVNLDVNGALDDSSMTTFASDAGNICNTTDDMVSSEKVAKTQSSNTSFSNSDASKRTWCKYIWRFDLNSGALRHGGTYTFRVEHSDPTGRFLSRPVASVPVTVPPRDMCTLTRAEAAVKLLNFELLDKLRVGVIRHDNTGDASSFHSMQSEEDFNLDAEKHTLFSPQPRRFSMRRMGHRQRALEAQRRATNVASATKRRMSLLRSPKPPIYSSNSTTDELILENDKIDSKKTSSEENFRKGMGTLKYDDNNNNNNKSPWQRKVKSSKNSCEAERIKKRNNSLLTSFPRCTN